MKYITVIFFIITSCISGSVPPHKAETIKRKEMGALEGTIYWKQRDVPPTNLIAEIYNSDFSKKVVVKKGSFYFDKLPANIYSISIYNEVNNSLYNKFDSIAIINNSLTFFTAFTSHTTSKRIYNQFIINNSDSTKLGYVTGEVDLSTKNKHIENVINDNTNQYGTVAFFEHNNPTPIKSTSIDSLGNISIIKLPPGIYKAKYNKRGGPQNKRIGSSSLLGIIVLPEKESKIELKILYDLTIIGRTVVPHEMVNFFWKPQFN